MEDAKMKHLFYLFVFLIAVFESAYAADALKPPNGRSINVAFVIGPDATIIDFTGPWEVFQDVMLTGSGKPVLSMDQMMSDEEITQPFRLYVVSETMDPLTSSGGMKIVPNFTFANAPKPDVIVIPAQRELKSSVEWVKKMAPQADITMSVCTGASLLAHTGLLDGQNATTHRWFLGHLSQANPKVHFVGNQRYVEQGKGKTSTAAGLTSGIDLALRVVERYFGRDIALATASYMEYKSDLWSK
jgi:transcriptional regulator GlxA family with amidase domain